MHFKFTPGAIGHSFDAQSNLFDCRLIDGKLFMSRFKAQGQHQKQISRLSRMSKDNEMHDKEECESQKRHQDPLVTNSVEEQELYNVLSLDLALLTVINDGLPSGNLEDSRLGFFLELVTGQKYEFLTNQGKVSFQKRRVLINQWFSALDAHVIRRGEFNTSKYQLVERVGSGKLGFVEKVRKTIQSKKHKESSKLIQPMHHYFANAMGASGASNNLLTQFGQTQMIQMNIDKGGGFFMGSGGTPALLQQNTQQIQVRKEKPRDDGYYALKTIKKDKLRDLEAVKQLMDQIQIKRELKDCPTVPKIIRVYETANEIKILQEYVNGENLYTLTRGLEKQKGVKFTELEMKIIVTQILLTLNYFERCGVSHRDLKPQNIFIKGLKLQSEDSGIQDDASAKASNSKTAQNIGQLPFRDLEVKIIDFGSCTRIEQSGNAIQDEAHNDLNINCKQGNQQQFKGSPGFVAPEVFEGKGYNQKSDIFSFGATLFTMLTRQDLWLSNNYTELLKMNVIANVEHVPEHLLAFCEFHSRDLVNFISLLLKTDPSRRISVSEALSHEWLSHGRKERRLQLAIKKCLIWNKEVTKNGFNDFKARQEQQQNQSISVLIKPRLSNALKVYDPASLMKYKPIQGVKDTVIENMGKKFRPITHQAKREGDTSQNSFKLQLGGSNAAISLNRGAGVSSENGSSPHGFTSKLAIANGKNAKLIETFISYFETISVSLIKADLFGGLGHRRKESNAGESTPKEAMRHRRPLIGKQNTESIVNGEPSWNNLFLANLNHSGAINFNSPAARFAASPNATDKRGAQSGLKPTAGLKSPLNKSPMVEARNFNQSVASNQLNHQAANKNSQSFKQLLPAYNGLADTPKGSIGSNSRSNNFSSTAHGALGGRSMEKKPSQFLKQKQKQSQMRQNQTIKDHSPNNTLQQLHEDLRLNDSQNSKSSRVKSAKKTLQEESQRDLNCQQEGNPAVMLQVTNQINPPPLQEAAQLQGTGGFRFPQQTEGRQTDKVNSRIISNREVHSPNNNKQKREQPTGEKSPHLQYNKIALSNLAILQTYLNRMPLKSQKMRMDIRITNRDSLSRI
ncbi:hypothetical protein FGO68_gene14063 [Halteria grandinella]|uniref:Protein kinase domain-containing protein n=1 Tax=Halteria grandinella TaxID=5974 RepID=A0A8J8T9M7_HALGN|nr:hypothetical protein FGO68_gene14063 [Halteria grandinella]